MKGQIAPKTLDLYAQLVMGVINTLGEFCTKRDEGENLLANDRLMAHQTGYCLGAREPKTARPTRTMVAPSAIAAS